VAKSGFKVLDSDMHVLEPPDLWQRYIDPAYEHVAPVGLTEMRRDMRVKVKSHVMLRMGPVRPIGGGAGIAWSTEQDAVYAHSEERGWDPISQKEAMDAEGSTGRSLPSRGLFVLGLDTPQVMGPTASSPTSPPPSRAPTTTGWPTSANRTPTASSVPPWWRRTTWRPRWPRRAARSSSSASRRSSWHPAA
jgi:hypothetical protein